MYTNRSMSFVFINADEANIEEDDGGSVTGEMVSSVAKT
jgi:hypothetical protein